MQPKAAEHNSRGSHSSQNSAAYEKVSDQGPVWVQSEDKIPGGFISTHHINI